MASAVVVGYGTIACWTGADWEIDDGGRRIRVGAKDMKVERPREGLSGVLTLEYDLTSRATRKTCFRLADDPMVKGRPIPVGLARHN